MPHSSPPGSAAEAPLAEGGWDAQRCRPAQGPPGMKGGREAAVPPRGGPAALPSAEEAARDGATFLHVISRKRSGVARGEPGPGTQPPPRKCDRAGRGGPASRSSASGKAKAKAFAGRPRSRRGGGCLAGDRRGCGEPGSELRAAALRGTCRRAGSARRSAPETPPLRSFSRL